MNDQNYFVDTPWTWRDRVRSRLLPTRYCDVPGAPAAYRDCVVVKTVASLSLLDRLRVLVTGKLIVETKTVTENIVGATVTASVAYPSL